MPCKEALGYPARIEGAVWSSGIRGRGRVKRDASSEDARCFTHLAGPLSNGSEQEWKEQDYELRREPKHVRCSRCAPASACPPLATVTCDQLDDDAKRVIEQWKRRWKREKRGVEVALRSCFEAFLRETGMSDIFIAYTRSLVAKPIEYYTCFIGYASKDEMFAQRLRADLQAKGVRCWFAPEDMKTGDVIRDQIDQSIRLYDKLLLVLSQRSVQSKWVRFEVEAALDKECEGKPPVLFPVLLDDAVLTSSTSWAAHIQRSRHITDFSQWKQHDDYQRAFTRLLRDLQPEKPSKEE